MRKKNATKRIFICIFISITIIFGSCTQLQNLTNREQISTATPNAGAGGEDSVQITNEADDEWSTFENQDLGISFKHPKSWSVQEKPEDRFTFGEKFVLYYTEVEPFCLGEYKGDCPIVDTISELQLSGFPAKKLTGYIGAVGGNIPQEYVAYVIEYGQGYLVFVLYALGLDIEEAGNEGIWPLDTGDVELFEEIIASVMLSLPENGALGSQDVQNNEQTETASTMQNENSDYWITVEDTHYGVRFAVPCFWTVSFPKEYHSDGQGYPIRNYTEEYVYSFGKHGDEVWENGGIKIDMNFISGDTFGIPPETSLLEFATMLTDINKGEELVSTKELTINHQDSLLVTTEDIFGKGEFYLFHISDDLYLIFSPISGTVHNPDVQAILESIAIDPDTQVKVPELLPGAPPEGLEAPCLEISEDYCCYLFEDQKISLEEANDLDEVQISGTLFSQYLELFLDPTLPDSCHLTSFAISEISIDPDLGDFIKEQEVDWVAWAVYSVLPVNIDYWIAGNGVLGDEGWMINKTMLVGILEQDGCYVLKVFGTGP